MAATTNMAAFLAQFKKNQQIALDASSKTINATVMNMYKKIIDRTPVGDPSLWNWPAPPGYTPGTLKASWKISFDGGASGKGISLKINSNGKQVVTISNSTVYAERIEYGHWSTQAPQGMLRITVAEYTSILNGNAAKYRIV